MQTFGAYQTRDRIRSGAATSIYDAEGDRSQLAIKALHPLPGLDERHNQSDAAAWMLESAWVQRDAAALPGGHWAPIHDLGQQDGVAYTVTDRFATSLDDLIVPGRPILPNVLRVIVQRTAAGLDEAERLLGRAHGNLKPSNVLIDGPVGTDALPTRVCLCDPAPGSGLRRRLSALGDRQDLGRLIVAAVTGKPTSEAVVWPVPHDPEWAGLGIVGEGWRSLASDLLNPAPDGGPMPWEEVLRRTELLFAPAVGPRRWPWALAAALIFIAAGVTTYFLYPRNVTPPATFDELVALAQEYNDWAGTAQSQLNDTSGNNAPLTAYVNDRPDLAQAVNDRLRGPGSQPLQPRQLLNQDDRFFRDLLQAVTRQQAAADPAAQQTIEQTIAWLNSEKPAARRAKEALEAVLAARAALEAYIDQTEDGLAQRPGLHPDAARIMSLHAEYAHSGFGDDRRHVLPAIRRLELAAASLTQAQDTLNLARQSPYGDDPFVLAVIAGIQTGLEQLAEVQTDNGPDTAALIQLREQSAQLSGALRSLADPTVLHYRSFARLHDDLYTRAVSGVDPALIELWRQAIATPGDAHVPQDQNDPRAGWTAEQRVAMLQGQIAELVELEDTENAQGCQALLDEARGHIAAVRGDDGQPLAWTQGNLPAITRAKADADGLLNQLALRLEADLTNARRDWATEVALLSGVDLEAMTDPAENIEHYFALLQGHRFSESDALERGWVALRDQVILQTRDNKAAIGLQKGIHAAVLDLRAIDQGLAADTFDRTLDDSIKLEGWDRDQTADRYWQQRESVIDTLIALRASPSATQAAGDVSPTTADALPEQISGSQATLESWAAGVLDTIQSYRTVDQYFADFYQPDDAVSVADGGEPIALIDLYGNCRRFAQDRGIGADLSRTDARFKLLIELYSPGSLDAGRQAVVRDGFGAEADTDLLVLLEAEAQQPERAPALRAAAALAALRMHDTADAAQLARLLGLRGAYEQSLADRSTELEEDWLETIAQRFDVDASLAWQRSVERAEDWGQADPLFALYPTLAGVDTPDAWSPEAQTLAGAPNQLAPLSRANIYLHQYQTQVQNLRKHAADTGLDRDEEDRQVYEKAKAMLAHLVRYRNDHPDLDPFCARLERTIANYESGKPQLMTERVGPMCPWLEQLGVKVTLVDGSGDELKELREYRFEYAGKQQTLAFRLVQPADQGLDLDAPPAYVSTSEVPARFLIELLDATNQNEAFSAVARLDIQKASPIWETDLNSERIMFRNWEAEALALGRAAPWVSVYSRVDAFKQDAAAPGLNEQITDNHPIHMINASAAYYFARLLGCRLPTLSEWRSAYQTTGNPPAMANVRDQTWLTQQNHLTQLNQAIEGDSDVWTSRGSITAVPQLFGRDVVVAGGAAALPGDNDPADYDDGYAWPRAVRPDAKQFEDLVGNLAEWVVLNTGEASSTGSLEIPQGLPTPAEVKGFFDRRWTAKELGVIGNSALSCSQATGPEDLIVLNEHIRLQTTMLKHGGYADVGFRLAFTVGQPRLSITVSAMLKDPTFLVPVSP